MRQPDIPPGSPAPAKDSTLSFAGFWVRVLATGIDCVVLGLAALLGGLLVFRLELLDSLPRGVLIAVMQLSWIGPFLYFIAMEAAPTQGTVGKIVLGLRITDLDGRRISVLQALGRTLSKLLSYALWCSGFVMIAFTVRKQGLHDKLAGTLVVYTGGAVTGRRERWGWIVRALRGEANLGGAFWGIGAVGCGLLLAAFWGLSASWDAASEYRNGVWMPSPTRASVRAFAEHGIYAVALVYLLWHLYASVSIWRCAKNTATPIWGILARFVVVLSWGGEAVMLLLGWALSGMH